MFPQRMRFGWTEERQCKANQWQSQSIISLDEELKTKTKPFRLLSKLYAGFSDRTCYRREYEQLCHRQTAGFHSTTLESRH
jgi:hypothetical protein